MILSIIIPIYNAGRVLRRTLNSVLNQGLKDSEYELILVNDGSTDNSLDICYEYREKFPAVIKVISKQNEGLPITRNVGMGIATGEYLYFMDADDYLMSGGFRHLIDNFFSEDYDILTFSSRTINDFDETHIPSWDINGVIAYDGYGCDFLQRSWQTFVWNEWYKKDFLISNQLSFLDIRAVEDIYFNLQVWSKNPKVRIVTSKLYCYINYGDDRQLTKKRDPLFLRACMDGQMTLFSKISEVNEIFKESYNSNNLENLFQSTLRSFMSRALTSDITETEFRSYVLSLRELGLLPMKHMQTNNEKIINFMLSHVKLFPVYKFLYQKLFVPFVLPRLSRE